jgi:protein-S-isoprenylcysteine O-methyltransferase Ste14
MRPRQPFLRMPVPWVFVLAYLVGVGVQLLVRVHVSSSTASVAIQIAGGVAFAIGAGLAGWSLLIFRRAATTTVPGETSRELVTRGPYRLTRNPMYVGLILAYLGEEGLLAQIWPLLFLPVAVAYVNWFVLPVEEAALKTFDGYSEYRARVRRWI